MTYRRASNPGDAGSRRCEGGEIVLPFKYIDYSRQQTKIRLRANVPTPPRHKGIRSLTYPQEVSVAASHDISAGIEPRGCGFQSRHRQLMGCKSIQAPPDPFHVQSRGQLHTHYLTPRVYSRVGPPRYRQTRFFTDYHP